MSTIIAVIGFIILVTGSQSGWLFTGGVAFVLGSMIANEMELVKSEFERIVFSITSSILGGLLVLYLRRIMTVASAFIAGGYICLYLPRSLGWDTDWLNWIYVLVSACAAAILTFLWGSLPLILISTVMGATLIVQHMNFGSIGQTGMFIVLSVFGVVAQYVLWHYSIPDNEE